MFLFKSKKCDSCSQDLKGWGSTCGDCRKAKAAGGAPAAGGAGDNCAACGKVVYAMEKTAVEGATFHTTCFKCTECGNKLALNAFSKADDGKYYCKTHYDQLVKTRGRYSIHKDAKPSDTPDGELEQQALAKAQAEMGADNEQARRVAEQKQTEEEANRQRKVAQDEATKAVDEEQARRVAEGQKSDADAAVERVQSQSAARNAVDVEQKRRVSEHGSAPRKSLTVVPDELAVKLSEVKLIDADVNFDSSKVTLEIKEEKEQSGDIIGTYRTILYYGENHVWEKATHKYSSNQGKEFHSTTLSEDKKILRSVHEGGATNINVARLVQRKYGPL